jgi:hypothetical protein
MKTIGTATIPCTHNEQRHEINFQIVDRPVCALLGVQDSVKLGVVTFNNVHTVKPEVVMSQTVRPEVVSEHTCYHSTVTCLTGVLANHLSSTT